MKQFILLVFLIAHADTLVLAQIHGLVKDINTTGRYNGLKVSETCAVGNVLYMAADDGLNGTELWKSDGTPEGTQMVKNLHSRDRQFLFPPRTLTNINGTLYFYGFTGGAFFLFKTDGTDRGTTVVKEVGDRAYDRGGNLLAIGNSIYFTSDGGLGTELWKTDGTQEGTVLVKDLVPGYEAGNPGDFVEFKGNLYFYTYDYFYRPYTLWKSDGTAEGTEVVGVSGAFRMPLKVANGNLYYVTYMGRRLGVPIYTLRRTNGIASEIIVRQDVYALDNLTVVGNTLFFTAVALHAGVELWKTDGSVAGTQLVKDINPATEVSSDPGGLVRVGNRLYFTASDGTHGRELWQSGGTSANTSMIADINPGEGDAHITGLTAVGTAAAFSADDGTGRRLWKSDGLAAGTQVLSDTDATWLTDVNGLLYFNGLTDNGLQIFKSNMEPGGTSVITSISRPASVPMNFVQLNGVGYFTADDAFHGRELWRSDGKSAGTYLVKDITPGADSSAISNLVNIAGSLYFTLPVTATGASLWKSDGTQAGTVLLKGVFSQMPADSIQGLTNVDGTLFFGVYTDGMMGLWKSDGTNEGTVLVKGGLKTFFAPVTLNGILYFGAYDGINSAELWKSDGTGSRHGCGDGTGC
ncbi:ELWxxDGT repeat protein [Dyadobacter sp. NIV53]|uniref:ELWxxDGT repeat protein n=1 Tax=Dyadobacter sp. NIV53 TaxID=2861765 RepID=UPI001C87A9A0|nr:ELWxxDGT repeat protein [Dyadobacter sp. NIV53]